LVALKSSVQGGVQYCRVDLAPPPADQLGQHAERWETTKVTLNLVEHDRACRARSAALAEIRRVCSPTSFGLLCPEEKEAELDEAVKRARLIRDVFNEQAQYSRVDVFVLKGRIASTDEEAMRAIGEEVSGLIQSMSSAIDRLEPEAIREAAQRARQMQAMLTEDLSRKVGEAVEAARKAARQIVKRVEKDGEEAAVVLSDIQRGALEVARMAFLDLSDDPSTLVDAERLPAVDARRFAGMSDEEGEKEEGTEGGSGRE
jgi:hypothetical protein